jgi:Acyl-CoA reductase (LuxC)
MNVQHDVAGELISPAAHIVPSAKLVIRGRVILDNLVEVGGRGGDLRFTVPDIRSYIDDLPLGNPSKLADLYDLSFDDILDYLEELGRRLDSDSKSIWRRARELSYLVAPTTPSIVDASYRRARAMFSRDAILENVERNIGVKYLEGWVEEKMLTGATVGIRCFGSRCLHIVAGNHPTVSTASIIRNAVLRSDAIVKTPSNDPFTASAIAEIMCDMAPDHPLTKHLTVAYWKGGDADVEEKLYQPQNIEKIIAWGGFASMKHVTRYIQPGLELISLDPKRSASIVGKEAFGSHELLREAAVRIASDVGAMNQTACSNARVVYAMSGTDADGLQRLETLGRLVYEELLALPQALSTKPKAFDRELKAQLDAIRYQDDWYLVLGGEDDEGSVIVSRIPEAVEFATTLCDRTANLVPVDSLDEVLAVVNSYTQTVGVFPETLINELRDILPLHGAQRIVSLGYAVAGSFSTPQDGIEPLRRMGKWITCEKFPPETCPPPWAGLGLHGT